MGETPKPIQAGADSRKNWKTINQLTAQSHRQDVEIRRLRDVTARRSRGAYRGDRVPFEVFALPNFLRAPEDRTADSWRIFFVQHGYVDHFPCAGCYGAEPEEAGPVDEIKVPVDGETGYDAAKPYWWIWVEWDLDANGDVDTAEINHGKDAWEGFPAQSGDRGRRLLARIDIRTHADRKRSVVKQYQHHNIWIGGASGGGSYWLP